MVLEYFLRHFRKQTIFDPKISNIDISYQPSIRSLAYVILQFQVNGNFSTGCSLDNLVTIEGSFTLLS